MPNQTNYGHWLDSVTGATYQVTGIDHGDVTDLVYTPTHGGMTYTFPHMTLAVTPLEGHTVNDDFNHIHQQQNLAAQNVNVAPQPQQLYAQGGPWQGMPSAQTWFAYTPEEQQLSTPKKNKTADKLKPAKEVPGVSQLYDRLLDPVKELRDLLKSIHREMEEQKVLVEEIATREEALGESRTIIQEHISSLQQVANRLGIGLEIGPLFYQPLSAPKPVEVEMPLELADSDFEAGEETIEPEPSQQDQV